MNVGAVLESPTARRRGGIALFAAVVAVPILLMDAGRVQADTKSYLYLDPGRLLRRAVSMWDPSIGLGTTSHQNIGYLFPLGPYYWVMHEVFGVPSWVAQRLLLATMLFAAGMGVRYLMRTMSVGGPGVPVAMLAYAFTPYVIEYSSRLSVLLGPWAALPFLLAFVIRGMHRGGWKYAAWFAIVVQLVGSVNASSLIFAGLGPVLWIPFAVLVARDVTSRQAWSFVWRTGLLTIATSLWWMSGLWVEGKYGLNILRFTESIRTVSATAYPYEFLRGLGYWFFYGRDRVGQWNDGFEPFTLSPAVVFVSLAVPATALWSAGAVRWRYRSFFTLLVPLGIAIAVGAAPYDDPSIVGSLFKSFATTSTVGFALRSTARATPLVVLGLSVLLGVGVSAFAARMRTRNRPWLGIGAAALVGAMCLVNAPGAWRGVYYSDYLGRDETVPAYWSAALRALDAAPHDTRVLALPGADFAAYRWGDTVDPIEPGLIDRPYVARELVPWGSDAGTNLLIALDRRVQETAIEPDAVAPIARLLGVGDIVLRMDLETDRFLLGVVPAGVLWDTFTDRPPDGLTPPTEYGTEIPGALKFPELGDLTQPPADDADPPPVAVLGVDDPLPIARAKSVESSLVVSGDGEGLVDLAAAGLLDAGRAVLYSASHDPAALRRLVGDGSVLVLTDSNRRRGLRWQGMSSDYGATETAGEIALREDPLDQRLEVFPSAGDDAATVTELDGAITRLQSTGYGSPDLGYRPGQRAAAAFDGNPDSAWLMGDGRDLDDERLELELATPITTDHLDVVQPEVRELSRSISRISLRFDDGAPVFADLDRRSRDEAGQQVRFSRRTFSKVELRIEALRERPGLSVATKNGYGFTEIRIADDAPGAAPVRIEETMRLPRDLLDALGAASNDHALAIVLSRETTMDGSAFRRRFDLPAARTFSFGATAQISTFADDDLIDRAVGLPAADEGGITATSSERLGNPIARASSAIDGDAATAWSTPIGKLKEVELALELAAPVTIDRLDLQFVADGRHSLPTTIDLTADDGTARTITIPESVRFDVPGGRVSVPVEFEPISGRSFTFEITAARPVLRSDLTMPIAIAELGMPGVRRAPLPERIPDDCIDGLVEVDGVGMSVRLAGSTADAVAQRPLAVSLCEGEGEGALALDSGEHDVSAASSPDNATAFDIGRIVLRSAPGGGPARGDEFALPAADRLDPVEVVSEGRANVEVRGPATNEPYWFVLGQSLNSGWVARADGHDLGPATLVDGFSSGWIVPARSDGAPATITVEWKPQRVVSAALLASLFAMALCLGIVLLAGRRRLATGLPTGHDPVLRWGTVDADRRLGRGVRAALVFGLGGAAMLLVEPWVGVVVAATVAFSLHDRRVRAAVRVVPPVVVVLVGAYLAIGQIQHHYPPRFDWPTQFDAARVPTWIALMLLAVEAALSAVLGDDAAPDTASGRARRTPAATVDGSSGAAVGRPTPWWRVGAIVVGSGAVVPLVIAASAGALDVPRSDDWSYLLTLFRFSDSGQWDFNEWVSMTLAGQVLATVPVVKLFGDSVVAARVFAASVGVLGLGAVVGLGGRLGVARSQGLLVAATLALGPLWGPLASTYMTEVPSFAAQTAALGAAAIALRGRPASPRWLAVALGLAFFAVTIRQYAIVVAGAILVAAFVTAIERRDVALRKAVYVLAGVFAVAGLGLLVWWSGVPGRLALSPKAPNTPSIKQSIAGLAGYLRLAGLLLLPVIVAARPRALVDRAFARDRRSTIALTSVALSVLVVGYALDRTQPFVGNYLDRRGVLADDIISGSRPLVMPELLFELLVAIGTLGALVLVVAMIPAWDDLRRRVRGRDFAGLDPVVVAVGLTVVGTLAAYELAILCRLPIFDRYALGLLPLVGLLLLRSAGRSVPVGRTLGVVAAVAAIAGLGIVYSAESASFDATRWKVAELAMEQGYSAADIDAGYEWAGWRRDVAPPYYPAYTPAELLEKRKRYLAGACVAVVIDPPRRPEHVIAMATSSGLLRGSVPVYAVLTDRACADPPRGS